MGRRQRRDFRYVDAVTVGRTLPAETRSVLRMLPGQPYVGDTHFCASVAWDDYTPEMEAFVARHFDAWLFFDNFAGREVSLRVPRRALPADCTGTDALSGLCVEEAGDDLLLRFRHDMDDSEGFNLGETGEGWLEHILPVRDELMAGTLDALDLGPMLGRCFGDRVEGEPDVPAAHGLSKATRTLAAFLLIDPACLQLRADGAGPCRHERRLLERRSREAPRIELLQCWEFVAAGPGRSFRISLHRGPRGYAVSSTEPDGRALEFPTVTEARAGYHDEALRLQRRNDPGNWRQIA